MLLSSDHITKHYVPGQPIKIVSTITQHVLANPNCAKSYKNHMFSILDIASNSFQQVMLEAVHITFLKLRL